MNPQVKIDSKSIKDSLKRNGIGKAIVTIAFSCVVYFSFTGGYIGLNILIGLFVGYTLLMILLDYFIAVSVIIDKGVFAMFKRAC